jgi:hypothetical protein
MPRLSKDSRLGEVSVLPEPVELIVKLVRRIDKSSQTLGRISRPTMLNLIVSTCWRRSLPEDLSVRLDLLDSLRRALESGRKMERTMKYRAWEWNPSTALTSFRTTSTSFPSSSSSNPSTPRS